MTKETISRLHKHFSNLAEGKFKESDFDFKLQGEGGSSQMGEMSPIRRELIKSDALKHKQELEQKHPEIFEKEKKEDKNILDKVAENKTQKKAKK